MTITTDKKTTAIATNKQVAEKIALNDYLSNWEGDSTAILSAETQPDTVEVWQPFENWDWPEVQSNIQNLADRIEEALDTASGKRSE